MFIFFYRSLDCFKHLVLLRRTNLINLVEIHKRDLNLLEYRSYQLLQEYGIPTPKFGVAKSKEEAKKIFESMKLSDCVIKAQVLTGGRQKGHFRKGLKHGVHIAKSADEVQKLAEKMIGDYLITKQTGSEGLPCNTIMITENKTPKKEFYFAVMMDRSFNGPALICSAQGGTSIEDVAKTNPDAIITEPIDIIEGLSKEKALKVCQKVGLTGKPGEETADTLIKLYKMFIEKDAVLLEMNPYVEDNNGNYCCLDAKFRFDDYAKFRQRALFALHDPTQEVKEEREAHEKDINYIKLNGIIGCLVNGAGLAMATMDIIKLHSGEPANFLDVGGAATVESIQFALETILHEEKVLVIFVNIFGGIMRCDMIAQALIIAVSNMKLKTPIVCRLLGTQNQEAKIILKQSKLKILSVEDFDKAALTSTKISKIITLAKKGNISITVDSV